MLIEGLSAGAEGPGLGIQEPLAEGIALMVLPVLPDGFDREGCHGIHSEELPMTTPSIRDPTDEVRDERIKAILFAVNVFRIMRLPLSCLKSDRTQDHFNPAALPPHP